MTYIKAAVLSDIHGNHMAFEKCLEYALAERADTFIFLGDYLGEFPYPQRTLAMLYDLKNKYNCCFIRGNKEDYWINRRNGINCGWEHGNKSVGAMKYCYQQLSGGDIDFFEQMPIAQTIYFEGHRPIMACHGTPFSNRAKMLPNDRKTEEAIRETAEKIILCGHTHCRQRIDAEDKCVLNPGAVGVPLHSGGQAQFMILESAGEAWKHEFISIPYDVEKEIEEIHTSGLYELAPYWCRITEHLLRTGEISHGTVLEEAMTLNEYRDNWYEIPDNCWIEALRSYSFPELH